MQTDTIRLIASYLIAILSLAGCFVLLLIPSQAPIDTLIPFITGTVGLILGWTFQKEGSAASARQTERAVTIGQSQPTPQ